MSSLDVTLTVAADIVQTVFKFDDTILKRRASAMDELTEYLANSGEDGFWDQIQPEARHEAEREPMLASFLFASVLRHEKLEDGLGVILANKLQTPELPAICFAT